MPSEKMTGAQAVIRALELEEVDWIFGMPGGTILPIYDALFASEKLKHVLIRHEQVGGHAAEGYAHATGKVGVCMGTSGPGSTNLVTPIADAYMDSVPLVVITANVATSLIGSDAFQEADITGITMPVTKHNYLVTEPGDIPRVMKEAFHLARTGRPGPVHVDIPKDVLNLTLDFEYPSEVRIPGYMPRLKEEPKVAEAATLIRSATRPVIYLGGGVRTGNAFAEVFEFCELVGAPVVTTLHGKGAFPETHPSCLGMFGMHGSRYANYTVQGADLLIALGARFDDRVTGKLSTFAPEAKIVHLDIDPAEISKLVTATVPLVGDVKELLPKLGAAVRKAFDERGRPDLAPWWKKISDWREKHPLRIRQEGEKYILPQTAVHRIWQKCDGRAIVTTGVGEHQMWAAQFWKVSKPREFITSGGLGTMGVCLPFAIGIQLARPDALVVGIDGDGSFQMTLQDLATAVEHELPIKIFVLNNLFLGMVRQWQELFYDRRFSETPLADLPDLVKLAEAYKCLGLRARTLEELDPVIDQALAHQGGPCIVDIRVKRQEKVYPMVPAGAPLNDMIGGE
ncbi:biosynthetic-type acetolactate synthase large subunit [Anaeromyxobacter diazotrophicus]|uniref:Acetolactate synthase n=1 Tax=Anaeromyxobacter diazotrophicus TaxID=2590199 RepID=A0A7I9VPD8_9BACT|nr:biosynthetic-type acetolactate synthase large subunit [Anaeromyxobacter diazotrophicus]GEJ58265.1 acetolactate synthase [Anaeromyxobacter diazotrophicus]